MVKYPFDMLTMQLKECRQLMKCENKGEIIVLDCCNANTRINVMKCENPVETVLKLEYRKLNHW